MPDYLDAEIVRHITALRRYAIALTRDISQADDLVQECLARALKKRRLLINVEDIRAYLFRMLHNVRIDNVRAMARQTKYVKECSVESEDFTRASQEDWIDVMDFASVFDTLTDDQRSVLLLVGLEGMTYEETASILDIPTGTVMSRLSRARESLRAELNKKPPQLLRLVEG